MFEAIVTDSAGQEKKRLEHSEIQIMVNKMTNWQRNQWARAGYPKKWSSDILPFLITKKSLYDKTD